MRLLEEMVWQKGAVSAAEAEEITRIDSHAERMIADEVSTMFWLSEEDIVDVRDLGPIRPPFDTLWVEWRTPDQLKISGEMVAVIPREFPKRCGVSIQAASVERYLNYKDLVSLWDRSAAVFTADCWMDANHHPGFQVMPMRMIFGVDNHGRWVDHKTVWNPDMLARSQAESMGEVVDGVFRPVMHLSLALCNAVNVAKKVEPAEPLSRQQRRRGQVRYSYRTIRLPQPRLRGSRAGAGLPSPTALHKVRGHFKTYTPEAPLLGRHVGTYWWGWQVRGDVENGVALHDYEVAEEKR